MALKFVICMHLLGALCTRVKVAEGEVGPFFSNTEKAERGKTSATARVQLKGLSMCGCVYGIFNKVTSKFSSFVAS